jgi:hypothetical protein
MELRNGWYAALPPTTATTWETEDRASCRFMSSAMRKAVESVYWSLSENVNYESCPQISFPLYKRTRCAHSALRGGWGPTRSVCRESVIVFGSNGRTLTPSRADRQAPSPGCHNRVNQRGGRTNIPTVWRTKLVRIIQILFVKSSCLMQFFLRIMRKYINTFCGQNKGF